MSMPGAGHLQLPIPALADKAAFATSYRRTCRGDAHVVAQEAEARDLLAVLSPASRVARQSPCPTAA